MSHKLTALLVVLAIITHARVTVLPGVSVPLMVAVLAAETVLCTAGGLAAWRLVRRFRSSPRWRPAHPHPATAPAAHRGKAGQR